MANIFSAFTFLNLKYRVLHMRIIFVLTTHYINAMMENLKFELLDKEQSN